MATVTAETREEQEQRKSSWLGTGAYLRFQSADEFQGEFDKHVPTGDVFWLCQAAIIRIGQCEDEIRRWQRRAEMLEGLIQRMTGRSTGDTP
jgi:hypothetical protein